MNLVWKLLRQHISIPQFLGFFLANLVGMLIILVGIQFYYDTQAVYNGEDSFMKSDFIIINKKVNAISTITGKSNSFSNKEIEDIEDQSFVDRVGQFKPSAFNVKASFNVENFVSFSTEMFFESVPDEFVDVKNNLWKYNEGDKEIPIILPKNYLDLYNFGFAQSRSLPKMSEGILHAMKLGIKIKGNGNEDEFTGSIVGFSSRLNTILVPEAFMTWANKKYSSPEKTKSTRLIMKVNNPTDPELTSYLSAHNYETDESKLDASKTNYFLKVIVGIVMGVGVLICVLSFYILMLSIYLLVEKNTSKLENLLLIGYSPSKVCFPYQALTVGMNILVLILSFSIMLMIRHLYLGMFESFFPDMIPPSVIPSIIMGVALLIIVSLLNVIAIRNKVTGIIKK